MSEILTESEKCQYKSPKLRVAIPENLCYIKSVHRKKYGKEEHPQMNIGEGIFAYKLYELEEQYGKLQCRIRACEQGDKKKIRSELQKVRDEYEENNQLLQEKVRACRSPAVSKLSQAQIEYRERTEELMEEQLANDVHSGGSSPEEDKAEAELLFAEYAMDFATLSMQQALIAAMSALEIQSDRDGEKQVGRNVNA